tara:strand:+ start:2938 stop:3798 length:861 start_codon:yes stop_codon:yes gene_type:complete
VWWDNQEGKWNAVNDMCPHRQAALSAGLISRDGNIKCGYHGWEYNGRGENTLVPQLGCTIDCNIRDFRVVDKYDILWFVEDKCEEPRIDILEQNNVVKYCSFDQVNLDYRLMIENTLDVSHLNHVHHGTLPLTRYTEQSNEGLWRNKDVLKLDYYNHKGFRLFFTNTNSTMTFQGKDKPISVKVTFDKVSLLVYVYPINYDSYHSLSVMYLKVDDDLTRMLLENLVKLLRPLLSKYINSVLVEDIEQITLQQANIRSNGKTYNLASVADKPIAYYMRWVKEFGESP